MDSIKAANLTADRPPFRFQKNYKLGIVNAKPGGLVKGVLYPRPVFWLFMHFSQKLQHIGNKYM